MICSSVKMYGNFRQLYAVILLFHFSAVIKIKKTLQIYKVMLQYETTNGIPEQGYSVI